MVGWAVVFWLSLGWLAYAYAGYPLLLWVLSRMRGGAASRGEYEPRVTLIISAHDEEDVIVRKLENSLALDYPRDKLEVIVASDGSTDRTDELAGGFGRGVRLYAHGRIGKSAMLNYVVPKASGDVLVLSDADGIYARDALKRLVGWFADPKVGCVSGSVRYVDEGGTRTEGAYQRLEESLKALESGGSSILGANGGIYAIRRDLYRPIPPHLPNDAYHPPQVVSMGYRAVYDGAAVAHEPFRKDINAEYARKVRIITRGLSVAGFALGMGGRPIYRFMYVSHKMMRWFAYVPLALLLASNAMLAADWPYRVVLAAQTVFWLAAFAGLGAYSRGLRPPLLRAPAYFALVNLAALAATLKHLVGERPSVW